MDLANNKLKLNPISKYYFLNKFLLKIIFYQADFIKTYLKKFICDELIIIYYIVLPS